MNRNKISVAAIGPVYLTVVFLLGASLPPVRAQSHPEPARVGGWQWSNPSNLMRPTSTKRNHIFYVGDTVTFTLGSGGPAISYEVRDYYGNMVASSSIPGGASTITIPVSQPGWYKLYLYDATSDGTFGDIVGGTMFVIFRNKAGFPANPAPGTAGGNEFSVDEILRGVCGIGPQRHSVTDVNNPTAAFNKLDFDVGLDKQYYIPFDTTRNRRLMMAFPNGVTSAQTANLSTIVNHFKADVKYWEPRNEPNFFTSGANFATGEMRTFYQTVKAADSTAKVIGPGTVSIGPVGGGLSWIQDFFNAGGGNFIDGFSFHIYNGANGDVTMCRKSLDALNSLLASFGQQSKEKWQTEQGYFAAVYGAYQPSHQGRWTMVQKMVFEQYRIPKEQDNLWYDKSHGFWDFPTWIENDDGSLNPGAVLMRVWSEELYGTTFSQAYDFGPAGTNIYIGSLFTGAGKAVAAFMSAGATDGRVTLNVSSGTSLSIVSAFGVASTIPVSGGQATLPVRELPVYVELASSQTISVVPMNYGQNLARLTGVTANSSGSTANIGKIFNGDQENWYYSQQGGTEPWDSGATTTFPCWVELNWPSAQTISRVHVFAAPVWQSMCSLLDYDLQYWNGSSWVTLQTVVEPHQTFGVLSPTVHTTVDSFYNERWIFLHNFSSVTTSRIRLWVRTATFGGGATIKVQQAGGQTGNHRVMLREIEVYGSGGGSPPAAPSGLAATPVSNSQINLNWTDNASNEDGFKIERKTGAGGTYAQIATVGANVTAYNNTGLSANTQYFYRVRANNAAGDSAFSNEANAWSRVGPPGYVWVADEGGTFTFTNIVDVAYGANGSYNYRTNVTGTITFNNATFGDPIVGVAKAGYFKPGTGGTGTGLTGQYYDNIDLTTLRITRTDATVNFDWGTGSPHASVAADTFSVRWTGQVQPQFSQTYTFYTTTDDGVRLWVNNQLLVDRWVDQGPTEWSGTIALTANQKYDIRMEYYENAGGAVARLSWSSASTPKAIIPQSQLFPTPAAPPATPTGLSATPGNAQVVLSWTASSGATSYNVKRSTTSGGPYTTIASPSATGYTNTGLANGTTYYYVVSAVNAGGESANSAQVSATPSAGAPDLIVTAVSWSPASPAAGQAVTFNATVRNQGGAPTPAGTIIGVSWAVDGGYFNYSDTNSQSLAAGASITLYPTGPAGSTTWTATAGSHAISAFVDDINRIAESNEGNNLLTNSMTVSSLPSPWQTSDIGSVSATGSANYANGTFTVVGSGADIWGTADEFRYVHQTASGDCEMRARVASVQNTDPWAKAGVMIRETTAAGSIFAAVFVTPGSGVSFQWRSTTGGAAASATVTGVTAPRYVRIQRTGSSHSAYYSSDGANWTQIGASQNITMATSKTIGLAVTSHLDGTLNTSTFDNVTASP